MFCYVLLHNRQFYGAYANLSSLSAIIQQEFKQECALEPIPHRQERYRFCVTDNNGVQQYFHVLKVHPLNLTAPMGPRLIGR